MRSGWKSANVQQVRGDSLKIQTGADVQKAFRTGSRIYGTVPDIAKCNRVKFCNYAKIKNDSAGGQNLHKIGLIFSEMQK